MEAYLSDFDSRTSVWNNVEMSEMWRLEERVCWDNVPLIHVIDVTMTRCNATTHAEVWVMSRIKKIKRERLSDDCKSKKRTSKAWVHDHHQEHTEKDNKCKHNLIIIIHILNFRPVVSEAPLVPRRGVRQRQDAGSVPQDGTLDRGVLWRGGSGLGLSPGHRHKRVVRRSSGLV